MGYFDGGFTVSDVFQSQLSETWATQQYFLPYFRNNVLLITGYPSTTTFISDASSNQFNLNVFGDTRASTLNPYNTSYNWSAYFDGSGDYLTISSAAIVNFSAAYTLELWFYLPGNLQFLNSSNQYVGRFVDAPTTGGFEVGIFSASSSTTVPSQFIVSSYASGGPILQSATGLNIPSGQWHHFAVVRNASSVQSIFFNGVRVATGTISGSWASNGTVYIGGDTQGVGYDGYFPGYIKDLRISNGTAFYDPTLTTLTVPTAPLTAITGTTLLTCQNNQFADNSRNGFAITKNGDTVARQFSPFSLPYNTINNFGSAYFDGTGDYLILPPNPAYALGTGDFTIEYWTYAISGTNNYLFQISDTVGGFKSTQANSLAMNLYTNGSIYAYVNGSTVGPSTTSKLGYNTWTHFAVVRSSGVTKVYINGILEAGFGTSGSITDTTNYTGTYIVLGGGYGTSFTWNGYLSDFRIVKGTAIYTGNFTPPAAPLLPMGTSGLYSNTANVNTTFSSANTSLLTLQTSRPHNNHTFFDNSPFNNLITRNGNPNQGTFSPYGTGWSNYFDGTGDYLTVPANAAFAMGTGDFTFEVWLYANIISIGTFDRICATSDYNGSGFDWTLNTSSSAFYLAGTSYNIGSIVPGVWHHLVYTRSGSNIRGFLNGNLSSYATGATQNISSVTQLNIGTGYSGTALNGYLSGLRIIKGSIPTEYQTSSTTTGTQIFTPPTSPLTAISGTSLLTCQSGRFKDNSVNDFILTPNGDVSVQKFSPYEPSPPFSDSTQFLQSSLVGGSTYFDGTGDWLTIPTNTNISFASTVAFTVEFWMYPTAYALGTSFNEGRTTLSTSSTYPEGWRFDITTTTIGWYSYTSGTTITTPISLNTWTHIALTHDGTTSKLYKNGILAGSGVTTWSAGVSSPFYIGALNSGSYIYQYLGYMSDIRLVKGTQVYTGNFTPPTAPLLAYGTSTTYTSTANINTTFAAANTTLLLNFANAAVKDYSGISTIEHTGNVRLVSNVSKYGGTAVYFDGLNGTQLKVSKLAANNPPTTVVGTANLTAEMWVYPLASAAGTSYSLFTLGSETTGRYTATIQNGQIKTNYYGAATANIGGNVQPNVWSHIAIVRNGSNINGYVNGVRLPNTETNANFIGNGGANIGADASGSAVFFGYIDDVRITQANVRYTANFSVPNQLIIP